MGRLSGSETTGLALATIIPTIEEEPEVFDINREKASLLIWRIVDDRGVPNHFWSVEPIPERVTEEHALPIGGAENLFMSMTLNLGILRRTVRDGLEQYG